MATHEQPEIPSKVPAQNRKKMRARHLMATVAMAALMGLVVPMGTAEASTGTFEWKKRDPSTGSYVTVTTLKNPGQACYKLPAGSIDDIFEAVNNTDQKAWVYEWDDNCSGEGKLIEAGELDGARTLNGHASVTFAN
ncbi:hypothetical protein [Streptomyces sp. NPDC055749]